MSTQSSFVDWALAVLPLDTLVPLRGGGVLGLAVKKNTPGCFTLAGVTVIHLARDVGCTSCCIQDSDSILGGIACRSCLLSVKKPTKKNKLFYWVERWKNATAVLCFSWYPKTVLSFLFPSLRVHMQLPLALFPELIVVISGEEKKKEFIESYLDGKWVPPTNYWHCKNDSTEEG